MPYRLRSCFWRVFVKSRSACSDDMKCCRNVALSIGAAMIPSSQQLIVERATLDLTNTGKIIHFAFAGTPHGSVEKLIHALDDGKVYDLPLPGLNTWGMCAEPQNLSYDAETGKLTYEAEIPQDLEWWRYFTLRRAGTYQYTYRPVERAGSVALVSLSATDTDPRQN